ncbi:MAG: VOC family protein [Candidatus Cybelea sp.]|jgi:catechol 2,3-dioxygenase-like lactoylglutathione lyase family enzyme
MEANSVVDVKLAFVMLGSSDLDCAIAFYSDLIGLRMSGRFERFALFETGGTTLALSGELAPYTGDRPTQECVFGVASVCQAYAALKDRIVFINEPRPINAGNWAVNFRDPDGHYCSFYGPQ